MFVALDAIIGNQDLAVTSMNMCWTPDVEMVFSVMHIANVLLLLSIHL